MDRRIVIIASIALAGVLLASYLLWPSADDDATLAEQIIIGPGDLEGQDWGSFGGTDAYPDTGNYSSHFSIKLDKSGPSGYIQVFVFVKTFNTPGQCADHYQTYVDLHTNGSDILPLEHGDGGFLLWHINGNGTCAICFTQENVFVWMDMTTNLGGNLPWEDEDIYTEAVVLIDAQSSKISRTLHP